MAFKQNFFVRSFNKNITSSLYGNIIQSRFIGHFNHINIYHQNNPLTQPTSLNTLIAKRYWERGKYRNGGKIRTNKAAKARFIVMWVYIL